MNFPDIDFFIKTYITKRPESLFKEDLIKYEGELKKNIIGKSVLIIGGAGTIGSQFIKALLKYKPGKVYVIDQDENGLTELVRDIRSTKGCQVPEQFFTYPLNFNDPIFEKIFIEQAPFNIVANFAAHKHVRSEKDHFSIEAMLKNNLIQLQRLLELLEKYKPQHCFFVSTDKAAYPVNVMGASKKLMEELIMSYAATFKISTARFANVAFSNGSLLYGFIQRIMKKQPLAGPSDIRRYFVSPTEAGELCLLSCILGCTGDIFFPKLPENQLISLETVTKDFINYLGYKCDICQSEEEAKEKAAHLTDESTTYPVYFSKTDTSGEKEYEEFYMGDENLDMNSFHSIGKIINDSFPEKDEIKYKIETIRNMIKAKNVRKEEIVSTLKSFIPDFHHIETGKSLDQKM
jgi:FlaA1/EpsC-like NDP-sugar epimerase